MDQHQQLHARLEFQAAIIITAEATARKLGITLEKADELLSARETYPLLQALIQDRMHTGLDGLLVELARRRWPQETVSGVRRDCTVELPPLPLIGAALQGKQ